ncbi:MAG: cysteine desulfurase [Bacillales bacterium]|nr:cysteine desulfurase [Bacillales bacterium]
MIYLDNSATTKPDRSVLESYTKISTDFWANPSSMHQFGGEAGQLVERARSQAASILGVNTSEIIFTSGGTESNNIAIKGIAIQYANRGNHIITSKIEHPSVREPFEQLAENGFRVTYLPVDLDGRISVDDLKNAMTEETILVSVMHVNNEIGTIQPIEEIGAIINKYPKCFFHVDGIQGFGKVPLDLVKSKVDLYSLSAHKFYGLKGTGLLYVRDAIQVASLLAGGNQERRIRSGTVNVAGAVSVAKAMRVSMEKYNKYLSKMKEMHSFLYRELSEINGIVMNSPLAGCAPHIVNFSIPELNNEVFARTLEEKQIYVSTTSACSSKTRALSKVVSELGKGDKVAGSSVRLSLSFETTQEEIETALEVIRESIEKLSELKK